MYLELSALEVCEARLSTAGSTWISISTPVTPAHRTSASATQDVVFAQGIDRGSWPSGNQPQYLPIIRPHHNNPGINGHASPHQQKGREDTGKRLSGRGPLAIPIAPPVISEKRCITIRCTKTSPYSRNYLIGEDTYQQLAIQGVRQTT